MLRLLSGGGRGLNPSPVGASIATAELPAPCVPVAVLAAGAFLMRPFQRFAAFCTCTMVAKRSVAPVRQTALRVFGSESEETFRLAYGKIDTFTGM